MKSTYYTMFGNSSVRDENENTLTDNSAVCYARKDETPKGRTIYYVRRGGAQSKFFNPLALYGKKEALELKNGLEVYPFREVNQKVFDFYLAFLRTKSDKYLTWAIREDN